MIVNSEVHNPKQVIIHTGFHKTASSSIQHSLANHRKLLETHGFHYPDFVVEGKRFYNRSIPLSGYYQQHPEKFVHYWLHNQVGHEKVNGLIHEFLEKESCQYDKLIFSDEFISALNKVSLGRIKSDFEAMGFEIRVISYVREPFNLLVSSIQQRSRVTSIKKALRSTNMLASSRKIQLMTEVFGNNAEFHCFEKACQHENGPVGFFFDLLQMNIAPESALKINESMSNQAARLSSFINQRTPLFITRTQINPGRKRSDLKQIHRIKGDRFGLTSKEAGKLMPDVDKVRRRISSLLGEEFLPECEPAFIPENVVWNEEQIDDLIDMSESLDLHILSAAYRYILDLDRKSRVSCPDKVAKFYTVARARLGDQNVRYDDTILDKFRRLALRLKKK